MEALESLTKLVCINDKNRPNEIPETHWIKEGEEYTLTQVTKLNIQNIIGYRVAEIDLTPFQPFTYFDSKRFHHVLSKEELDELLERGIIKLI